MIVTDTHKLKERLWEKLESGPFTMGGLRDGSSHFEPLTTQLDKDQVDTLWFFIGKDNRLAKGGAATVNFVAKGQDFFASLSGHATVDNDRAMIEKLWSNQVEAWFPGGKTDPNLALLRSIFLKLNSGRPMFRSLGSLKCCSVASSSLRNQAAMLLYQIRRFSS